MLNQSAERQIPRYFAGIMPYYYKYPEIDLSSKNRNADYEKTFAPGIEKPCEYAQDTTTWD